MFVGDEVRLDVGFAVARERLTRLGESDALFGPSADAYGPSLARVGPGVVSKLVRVQVRELSWTEKSGGLALRWEATGAGGKLFPVLDADLTLADFGAQGTLVALAGVYRPPLGRAGPGARPGRAAPGRRRDHQGLPRPGGGSARRPARR